jgi:hypothetical protein
MPDYKYRTNPRIPASHYRLGALWAWLKGRPVTTLIGDVFQARVEANEQWIRDNLAQRAKQMGKSPEELENEIYAEYGISETTERGKEEGEGEE